MQNILDQTLADLMESFALQHEQSSEAICRASQLLVNSLNQGGKIYFVSSQQTQPLADLAITLLMHSKQDLRPALPACLAISNLQPNAGANHQNSLESSLRKLRTLCQPQDCMIILPDTHDTDTVRSIDQFSREQSIATISISTQDPAMGDTADPAQQHQLCQYYAAIPLIVSSIARKQESTLFILNCLSAMIEVSLFGQIIES